MKNLKKIMFSTFGLAAAVLVLASSGCSNWQKEPEMPLPRPAVLPYQFHLAKFIDNRKEEDKSLQNTLFQTRKVLPFRQDELATAVVDALNKGLFVSDPAAFEMELLDTAKLKDGSLYLYTAHAKLKAYDEFGKLLGEGSYSCEREATDYLNLWHELQRRALLSHNETEFQLKTWEKLVKGCAQDMAYQFSYTILSRSGAQ